MNPIYVEYYSHEKGDCYKIDMPYSKYRKETQVLCPVSKGYQFARVLALGIISKHIIEITEKE